LFFEAVNEYGKDFSAIQRFFIKKSKNTNAPMKNKGQIRQFYYRTWAKISSKLHFPPRKFDPLFIFTLDLSSYLNINKFCVGWDYDVLQY